MGNQKFLSEARIRLEWNNLFDPLDRVMCKKLKCLQSFSLGGFNYSAGSVYELWIVLCTTGNIFFHPLNARENRSFLSGETGMFLVESPKIFGSAEDILSAKNVTEVNSESSPQEKYILFPAPDGLVFVPAWYTDYHKVVKNMGYIEDCHVRPSLIGFHDEFGQVQTRLVWMGKEPISNTSGYVNTGACDFSIDSDPIPDLNKLDFEVPLSGIPSFWNGYIFWSSGTGINYKAL